MACPVGALRLELRPQSSSQTPLRRRFDLVVVGAGPGGSLAAQTAAQAGLSVLLIEKRQEIGSPVRCAEGVGHSQLAIFLEPDNRWISAEITKAEITALADDKPKVLRAEGGRGYILERRVFDRVLAERAAQAGAEVRVKTAATGLIMENDQVRGIKIRHGDFFSGVGEIEIETQLIIAADGVESQVGRWAGLDTQLPVGDTMVCAQYLLAGINIDPVCTSYWISYKIAPGGYAWIFPKGEGTANVGLGVQADLWQAIGSHSVDYVNQETVLGYLTRFIESQPSLAQGYPVTLVVGNVPVALSPENIVKDGLMLVGDAARQVDALTGGGIINAMSAGKLAARIAVEAIEAGDTSANFLSRYKTAWEQSEGRKLKRNYRLRQKFPPELRADERFIQAFTLAVQG